MDDDKNRLELIQRGVWACVAALFVIAALLAIIAFGDGITVQLD